MHEEGGGEAVRSRRGNSYFSALCFIMSSSAVSQCLSSALLSCRIKLLSLVLPQSVARYRVKSSDSNTAISPELYDEDKAKGRRPGGVIASSSAAKGNNEHQQPPSPSARISVLFQDTYLYLSQRGLWAAGASTSSVLSPPGAPVALLG